MTEISYIAGIGAKESEQRAAGVPKAAFVPYLDLTKGEMSLSLMLQQAQILAGYYGGKKYTDAATMLKNALNNGVHGSTPYFGALEPELYGIARAINEASRQTAPASGAGFTRMGKIGAGIGEIIPLEQRRADCIKSRMAAGVPKTIAESQCQTAFDTEKILNDGLEKCGQYLAYGFLPNSGINALPNKAADKIQDQLKAIQSVALVGRFSESILAQWLNVGMMRNNAEVAKIEPYGWIPTNAYLTTMPQPGIDQFQALFNSASKWDTTTALGRKMTAIVLEYKKPGVGLLPAAVAAAIWTAIAALIPAISAFLLALLAKQTDALAVSKSFGTRAFGPEDGDWDNDGIPDSQQQDTGISPLLLLGGAAAIYAIAKD